MRSSYKVNTMKVCGKRSLDICYVFIIIGTINRSVVLVLYYFSNDRIAITLSIISMILTRSDYYYSWTGLS